ncbi:fimbrial protein [Amantichitinum ursilacus]|uniref:Type-1 fimbrial protein, A chain n=1 Tax=Amantichitinum ursilacus TaxID=857265 RepID=A0A0N0XLX5_9NEIS|nr:fimbrial protein [Amantichitinum ursilacus]KPC54121.1 Type-1 fimbrial protein, A chain precursor [Amantichitinum ursilacus]
MFNSIFRLPGTSHRVDGDAFAQTVPEALARNSPGARPHTFALPVTLLSAGTLKRLAARALRLVLLWIGLSIAAQSYAADPCVENTPFNLDFGTVAVRSTDAVGTVLASKPVSWTITCSVVDFYYSIRYYFEMPTVAVNNKKYAKTNVPGLGLYFIVEPNSYSQDKLTPQSAYWDAAATVEFARSYPPYSQGYIPFPKTPMTFHANAQLVVYAPITLSSTVIMSPITTKYWAIPVAANGSPVFFPSASIINSATVGVIPPTCAVDAASKSQEITLQGVKAKDFSGVGSTANSTSFSIKINCSGSKYGGTTKAQIGFTDVNNPANTGTTLSLSPKSTAQGVGLQISSWTGTLYSFGPETATWDAPGHTTLGDWGDSNKTLMLLATYVKTGATVKAGSLEAMMTFVMTYQ